MNWLARLKKIENTRSTYPTEPTKAPFVGSVGIPPGPFEKSASNDDTQTGRLALFTDRGLSMEEAQAMADRLAGRDLESDDRRLCIECAHLSGGTEVWRCSQWRKRQHYGPEIPNDLVTVILHRCAGFNDRLEAIA